MQFLNPTLAAVGLACVALPILIHILLRRRRKPIAWGAMRFLLEAYRQQRRRVRFEQFLLLAARCLLIALLALAVGKPVLGGSARGGSGARTLLLAIDNSITSRLTSDRTLAFDTLKAQAKALVDALDATRGDRVALIALATPAEALVREPTLDHASVLAALSSLEPVESRADFTGLGPLAASMVSPDQTQPVVLGVVSEFRGGSADTSVSLSRVELEKGSLELVATPPSGVPVGNTSISALDASSGVLIAKASSLGEQTASTSLRVDLRRSSTALDDPATIRIRLSARQLWPSIGATTGTSERVIRFEAGQEQQSVVMPIDLRRTVEGGTGRSGSAGRGVVAIRAEIDRDALEADNAAETIVEIRDKVRVGLVGQPGRADGLGAFHAEDWIAAALAPLDDGTIRTRSTEEMEIVRLVAARDVGAASSLGGLDAVIVTEPQRLSSAGWGWIRAALDRGAFVMVMPPAGETVHTWSDAMMSSLGVSWQIARESASVGEGDAGLRLATGPRASELLMGISSELEELVGPVAVRRTLPLLGTSASGDAVLTLSDGSPWLVVGAAGADRAGESNASRGVVAYLASAPVLEWTDLPARSLMVALFQDLVRQGVGRGLSNRPVVAGESFRAPANSTELRLVQPRVGEERDERRVTGDAPVVVRRSGVWESRGSDGGLVGFIAANADSRGGNVETQNQDRIGMWLEGLGPTSGGVAWLDKKGSFEVASSLDRAPPISLPLLIAAAVVGAIEVFLGKVFSHAGRASRMDEAAGVVA